MATISGIFEMTSAQMDKDIKEAAGPLEVMKYPTSNSFKIDLEVDSKVKDAVGKDPLLQQQMHQKIGPVYKDLVARIGQNLKNTDKGAIKLRDTNQAAKLEKLIDVVNTGIKGAIDVAKGPAEKAALEAWTAYTAVKKEYKDYKIKVGVKIAGALSGLIISITLFATGAVSFGATSIPSIVGMVKSCVTIGDEIRKLAQSIADAMKSLETNLKLVEKHFTDSQGKFTAQGKGAEAGALVFKQFTGIALPCIKTCVENLGTLKSKYAGTIVKAHDAAKELNKILLKVQSFKTEFKAGYKKILEKHPSPLAKGNIPTMESQLENALVPFETEVNDALAEVIKYDNRAKTFDPKIKAAEVRVGELVKLKGVGFKIFENVLVLSDLALSFADPSQFAPDKVSEACAGILSTAAQLGYDKITKLALEKTILE